MKPSYIYCKVCGYVLSSNDFPEDVLGGVDFPTDDEAEFDRLKRWAKKSLPCPACGNHAYIRKAYYKL